MLAVVDQVKDDVQRRDISFPTWESLHVPLRSTLTGERMIPESHPLPLLEMALHSIFIDKVDWRATYRELFGHLKQVHCGDSEVRYRVLGMGPGAESLVAAATDTPVDDGTVTGNITEFINEAFTESIAIVGLSMNFPSGKGKEQFWNTLKSGKSAISEV